MKNILIAQFKQLGRGKLKYFVFILLLLVLLINVAMFYGIKYEVPFEISTCNFIMENLFVFYTLIHIFISVSISDICSGDFSDKTFYYEILSGKTRFSSYFSRVIVAIVFVTVGCLLLLTLPLVLCTILCGWGDLFSVGDIVTVIAVSLAPLVRVICTYICIAFIVRNTYAVMALGMGGFMISSFTEMPFFSKAPSEILGMTSILNLCTFDIWQNYVLTDVNIPVVDATVTTNEILSVILWSLLFATAFLFIGYSYFKHDDLN